MALRVTVTTVAMATVGGCRLLWEFLAELLVSSSSSDVIRWEDESALKFKVVDPQRLAERWGQEKGKTGMTYEKLSRALRYYYKTKIVAKVRGQRLTYRLFLILFHVFVLFEQNL